MENKNYSQVSIVNWILTFILLGIPIVNIVMLFVWAFSSTTRVSKKNFAIAALIMMLIAIVGGIAVGIFFGSILTEFITSIFSGSGIPGGF